MDTQLSSGMTSIVFLNSDIANKFARFCKREARAIRNGDYNDTDTWIAEQELAKIAETASRRGTYVALDGSLTKIDVLYKRFCLRQGHLYQVRYV